VQFWCLFHSGRFKFVRILAFSPAKNNQCRRIYGRDGRRNFMSGTKCRTKFGHCTSRPLWRRRINLVENLRRYFFISYKKLGEKVGVFTWVTRFEGITRVGWTHSFFFSLKIKSLKNWTSIQDESKEEFYFSFIYLFIFCFTKSILLCCPCL
jgi:hypothetical protein